VRVLLDEHLPHRLRTLLVPDIEAVTVGYLGWSGVRNGELLRAAQERGFDVLLTMDRGIPHQQNLDDVGIGIVLVSARSNRFVDLAPLADAMCEALRVVGPGQILRVPEK
jgi:hypothetical protein